ncbi:Plasmodium exported protein, unknown function [Plasmodium sp.]|nr:Plasmodium exported protein, unknown function [Plasmodium sp.]
MLIKSCSSTKNNITNNRNINDIHDVSKNGKINISINYNIFNKIYKFLLFIKYLLLSYLIIILCIKNKNKHKKYFYVKYHYKNEKSITLQNRSLSEIHINNDYSNTNSGSKYTSNLRSQNINKNDRKNKNNRKEEIITNDNIRDDLISEPIDLEDLISEPINLEDLISEQINLVDLISEPINLDDLISEPKNLEDLIFEKRREEEHLNEGKDLSFFDKIKCFLDIFDDYFIDRMIDYSVQKKDSTSLKLIAENIVIHAMAFFPFSLPFFSRIYNRLIFYRINHEKK